MTLRIVGNINNNSTHDWHVEDISQGDAEQLIKDALKDGIWHTIEVGECFHPPHSILTFTLQE